MRTMLVRFSTMCVFALGLIVPPAAPTATLTLERAAALNPGVGTESSRSPEGLLNPDGTLKLDGGFSGSLDLSGWNVRLDPERGPLFTSPSNPGLAGRETTVLPGDWSALGGAGGGPLNDAVTSIAVMGTDIYVGGSFQDADNLPAADYLAKWDGTNWSAVGSGTAGGPSLGSPVLALAVYGTWLYAGGYFNYVNDGGSYLTAASYVAKWDGSHWSALGSDGGVQGSLGGLVTALAVDAGGNVYVGGNFTNVNNGGTVLNAADYLAKWNGANWSALGSGSGGDGSLNGAVYAIEINGTDLYAGGYFTNVNNLGTPVGAADYVARWNGTTWSALGSNGAGNGSIDLPVWAIAASASNIYVGGTFSNLNNNGTVLNDADYLARWDGSDWYAVGGTNAGNGSLDGYVRDILVDGVGNIYVAGDFINVTDGATMLTEADFVAKWDHANWSALGSDGSADGALNSGARALALIGTDLFLGGSFYSVQDTSGVLNAASYIAGWDGSNWAALGTAHGSINRTVNAITPFGTDVYVAGAFEDVGDQGTLLHKADAAARWDGAHWSSLAVSENGTPPLMNGTVHAVAVAGSDVYVGGYFWGVYNEGSVLVPEAVHIARWNGSTWSALGSNGAGGGSLNYEVRALALKPSGLFVGGLFTNVNNNGTPIPEADYVARWDGTNWSALGSNGAGDGSLSSGSVVYAIAPTSAGILVGGSFQDLNNGGTPLGAADYIARWDGTNWSALGDNGAGNGSLGGYVRAIAVSGGDVYVGGNFTNVSNGGINVGAADFIARYHAGNWSALGDDGAGGGSLNDIVCAIKVYGMDVYVGGEFANVNNGGVVVPEADFIAKWNGSDWSALGSNGSGDGSLTPAHGVVNAIALGPTDIYAGGHFYEVNNGGTVLRNADYVAAYRRIPRVRSDFDGDLKTDPAKFDPAAYTVSWISSLTGGWDSQAMGAGTYAYVGRSDFDGDGLTDPARFDASNSLWYVESHSGTMASRYMGPGMYTFVAGSDYEGDGRTDPAQFNTTVNALWYYGSNDATWHGTYLGPGTYTYVTGSDFDGDGKSDPAHFNYSSNVLWYQESSTLTWLGVYLGPGTYTCVEASDFDGDGKTDPAQFHSASNVLWYVGSTVGLTSVWMGPTLLSYVPATDFNGDMITDPAGFDPVAHLIWYLPSGGGGWTTIDMGTGTYTIVN